MTTTQAVATSATVPNDPGVVAEQFVGRRRERLSSQEREDHIRDCTRLMEEAYERYEESGNFADRGDADRWMRLRDEAIRGRSPAQVARLERERGLRGR